MAWRSMCEIAKENRPPDVEEVEDSRLCSLELLKRWAGLN